jgi:hypothetical protein
LTGKSIFVHKKTHREGESHSLDLNLLRPSNKKGNGQYAKTARNQTLNESLLHFLGQSLQVQKAIDVVLAFHKKRARHTPDS